MAGMGSRGFGLLLIVVAIGPLLTVLACSVLAALTLGGAVRDLVHRAEPMVATLRRDVAPAVTRLQARFSALETESDDIRKEVDGLVAGLPSVGSLRIATGQFGQTPAVHIRLPQDDVTLGSLDVWRATPVAFTTTGDPAPRFGSDPGLTLAFGLGDVRKGAEDIGKDAGKGLEQGGKALENAVPKPVLRSGAVIDKDLLSVSIPPAPVDATLPGLSRAFASLDPGGPVGKAVAATRQEMGATLDQAGRLERSLSTVAELATELLRRVSSTVPLMLATCVAIVLGVGALLLMGACASLYVCLRHPRDALLSFVLSPLGFVFYCLRSVLIEAATGLSGRPVPASRAEAIADLRRQVERLQADIAARATSRASVPL